MNVTRKSTSRNRFLASVLCLVFIILHPACAGTAEKGVLKGDGESQFRKVKTEGPLVYYEGTVTVTGLYHEKIRESEIGNFEAGLICFSVKGPTTKLIPRENDSRSPWFCFSNTIYARSEFDVPNQAPDGTCYIVGEATVRISHYIANRTESEVHDTANLDKVLAFGKPTFNKECMINR